MTILETAPIPQPAPAMGDPDLTHEVCCVDDDLTLCGRDASEMDWNDPLKPVACIVCASLLERFEELLPTEAVPLTRSDSPCSICPRRNQEGKR